MTLNHILNYCMLILGRVYSKYTPPDLGSKPTKNLDADLDDNIYPDLYLLNV